MEQKQYCRYCAHCVATLDDLAFCEKLQKEMGESSAKRVNKYKPRAEMVIDDSPTLF